MAFEDLELAVNASVISTLSNAEAVIDGAERIRVVFERPYTDALGVQSSEPVMFVDGVNAPDINRGSEVQIGSALFTVVNVEPDDSGMLRVTLEAP